LDHLKLAQEICRNHNAELLYLSVFGSNLYGTNGPDSDTDLKGIFLPSYESVLNCEAPKTLHYSDAPDTVKNQAGDIDLELYSLQYWLNHLVRLGETIGLDLLFSYGHKDMVLYESPSIWPVLTDPAGFLDSKALKKCAYIKFAQKQATKYGIKGKRLEVLRLVADSLCKICTHGCRLDYIAEELVRQVDRPDYIRLQEIENRQFINLCGKLHQVNIFIWEFVERVNKELYNYGKRAESAMLSDGVDWKAVSHCLRAIYQAQELLEDGKITFPLRQANYLKSVNQGWCPWQEVEMVIEKEMAELQVLQDAYSQQQAWPTNRVLSIIRHCYHPYEGGHG
jgi:hypothetical protein